MWNLHKDLLGIFSSEIPVNFNQRIFFAFPASAYDYMVNLDLNHFSRKVLNIRIPFDQFCPCIDEIMLIAKFLRNIHYNAVEVLPYHKMGEHKYAAMAIKCNTYSVPEEENIAKYRQLFNLSI